ncbi:unnamed protein product [Phytomonas sp. EM1]|nr:unnamed protein product [Phytomonas sp. EM1]|eukprot:CCW63104.1 unnamed protein product [Phytomonas sp. isolate EM1]
MHSRSTWPSRINFDIFHCYLGGYTADEAVEYLKSVLEQDDRSKSFSTASLSVSNSSRVLSVPPSRNSFNDGPPLEKVGEVIEEKTNTTPTPRLEQGLAKAEALETNVEVAPRGGLVEAAGATPLEQPSIPREVGRKKPNSRHERHTHGHHPQVSSYHPHSGSTKHQSFHVKGAQELDGVGKHAGGRTEDWLLNSLEQGLPSLAVLAVAAGYAQVQSLFDPHGVLIKKKSHHKHRHTHGGHAEAVSSRRHSVDGLSMKIPFMFELSSNVYFHCKDYRKYLFKLEQENTAEEVRKSNPSNSVETTTLTQLLLEEVREQYDFYHYLTKEIEYALGMPYAFLSNNYLPIPISDRRKLVELYYTVDPAVFRYYFGMRTEHFEPIVGTEEDRKSRGLFQRGAGPVEGRTLDKMTAYLAQISPFSLQRQWENIQRVCTSLTDMYHGKDNMIIPQEVSVSAAIKRCFGVSDKLTLHYSAAVFGFYYGLRTRILDRFNTYDDVCALCNIITSLWCDDSLLFLDFHFVAGMNRVVALIEEHRVLAELHQQLFSEAMRTRWQVQLDEVQRVMMPNSTGEKTTAVSALNIIISSAHGGDLEGKKGKPGSSNISDGTTQGGSSPTAFPHNTVESTPQASIFSHSLCCNRKYSRRFVLEFPQLIRHLTRMMGTIGGSRSVNDALEVFYHRIYVYLESLSSRFGQEGLPLGSYTPQSLTQPSLKEPIPKRSILRSQSASRLSSTAPTTPPTEEITESSLLRQANLRSCESGVRKSDNPSLESSKKAAITPTTLTNLPKSMSMPSFGVDFLNRSGSPKRSLHRLSSERVGNAASGPEVSRARAISPLALFLNSSTTNSSGKTPPTHSLRPEAPTRHANGDGTLKMGDKIEEGGRHGGEVFESNHRAPPDTANTTNAPDICGPECVMLKAIDKHHLHELLLLLSELPDAWRQLNSVTAGDHAECDEAFNSFVMALKVITQILIAADDLR